MRKTLVQTQAETPAISIWKLMFFLFLFYIFLISGCQAMNAETHNAQGVTYLEQKKYDLALAEFEGARLQMPEAPNAYYNIGSTYHKIGLETKDPKMYSMAEQYYNICLTKDANHVNCHRGLAVLMVETARTDNAIALLKSWESQRPNDANPKIEIARLHQELGHNDEASQYLTAAIATDPGNIRACNALGMLRETAGDNEQALSLYKTSIAKNPDQADISSRIAAIEYRAIVDPTTRMAGNSPVMLVPDVEPNSPVQTASRDPGGPRF